jgi:bifunctional isochorismate lyase/aryl carrier protein
VSGSVKERYFSLESLGNQAEHMREHVQSLVGRRALPFTPASSALLVLDMQNYFLYPASHAYIPSAEAIIPGIKTLIQSYRSQAQPVIFTRHVNTPQDAASMGRWWYDLIAEDSPLSQIIPELEVGDSPVLLKNQYDAFFNTDLEGRLREKGVTKVLVSGVMTHLCCETTARSAFMRGFDVFALVDGMASYNAQFHQASLLNLAHGFATLLLMGEALAAWSDP